MMVQKYWNLLKNVVALSMKRILSLKNVNFLKIVVEKHGKNSISVLTRRYMLESANNYE